MTAHYEERAAAHATARDRETRRSILISRLRLAAFVPGAICLVWAMARGGPPALVVAGAALLLIFAGLVVWHARVEERAAWYDALHTVNLHALARIGRDWDRLPPVEAPDTAERAAPPPRSDDASPGQPIQTGGDTLPGAPRGPWSARVDVDRHPYATDLDLFGRASLMQWIGPAATPSGGGTLQQWLLHPAPPPAVVARQQAVAELAPALEWREQFRARGRLLEGVRAGELEQFLRWTEGTGSYEAARRRLLRGTVLVLTASIWAPIALHAAGVTETAFWLIPILLGIVLSFVTAGAVHGEFNRAGAGQHAFARYADLFAHAAAAPTRAPHLQAIHVRLTASGSAAAACMRRLNRILGFAQLRTGAGILHFPIQALTLWDFHVFFALDTWRRQTGPNVRGWMEAVGELDALSAFAQINADNPAWCLPRVSGDEDRYTAEGLGHPLLRDDRRVGNDVVVGPADTLLLITGSNMSGKSTLLRAIGLNAVLAQAGAPACAASLRMPPVDLETSIRVQDSLEYGLSYFMAALARLKGVVDRAHRAREGRTVLYLLDEILQGTNTAERSIAVQGIARHLLKAGAIGVMTTHDLALAGEEPLKSAGRLAHFTETVDPDGGMSFDYHLRPGLATSRNALRLMHLIGLDLD